MNKLVEIRTQSPLDNGQGLLLELFKLAGEQPDKAPQSTGETTTGREAKGFFEKYFGKYKISAETRKLITDVTLGIGLGIGGIHLLT